MFFCLIFVQILFLFGIDQMKTQVNSSSFDWKKYLDI